MKTLTAILLLVLTATSVTRSGSSGILALVTTGKNSNVEQTCRSTPNYDLCVFLLASDPRSGGADTAGLALIVVSKINGLATSAASKIDALIKQKPHLRQPLSACFDGYKAIIDADVPEAIEALSKGVPKFAEDGVADAAVEAAVCEGGFRGNNSPLTNINKKMQDIAEVGRAIIRMLL